MRESRETILVVDDAESLRSDVCMATPLALGVTGNRGKRHRRRRQAGLASAALSLAGSLALRFLTTHEGYRSARTPDDTWLHTARHPQRDTE